MASRVKRASGGNSLPYFTITRIESMKETGNGYITGPHLPRKWLYHHRAIPTQKWSHHRATPTWEMVTSQGHTHPGNVHITGPHLPGKWLHHRATPTQNTTRSHLLLLQNSLTFTGFFGEGGTMSNKTKICLSAQLHLSSCF